jgi:hypothetical protein
MCCFETSTDFSVSFDAAAECPGIRKSIAGLGGLPREDTVRFAQRASAEIYIE